jgi:hypothetical protein
MTVFIHQQLANWAGQLVIESLNDALKNAPINVRACAIARRTRDFFTPPTPLTPPK